MSQKFDDLGTNRQSHLSYHPNLALCDFSPIEDLKNRLEGSSFGDPEALVTAIEKALADFKIGQWLMVYHEWIRRLRERFDGGGESLQCR
jgi:hypothetical protein